MPELPEVESARSLIERNCKNHIIKSVIAIEQGGGPRHGLYDDIVCVKSYAGKENDIELTSDDYVNALVGRKLMKAHRKGKQMWIELR